MMRCIIMKFSCYVSSHDVRWATHQPFTLEPSTPTLGRTYNVCGCKWVYGLGSHSHIRHVRKSSRVPIFCIVHTPRRITTQRSRTPRDEPRMPRTHPKHQGPKNLINKNTGPEKLWSIRRGSSRVA